MEKRLDIILFGVTGFTGKHVLRYLHKFASARGRNLTWGVAGRNEEKIRIILDSLMSETRDRISQIPIITADLSDLKSIQNMTSRARLLINCCGPYRFMGEIVIKACIETSTHHLDVSGEVYYMEKMQISYNEQAKEKGIYIVSACGFDSIPSEMGVIFLLRNFEGTLNSVETYLKIGSDDESSAETLLNYGTWESTVHEIGDVKKLRSMRAKLSSKLPKMEPKLEKKLIPFKPTVDKDWAVFFPGPDRPVMIRTQRHFHEERNNRPIQIQTYLLVNKFKNIILLGILGLIFTTLCRFRFGRHLLLKYPGFFSLGFFDTKEPSEKNLEKAWFCLNLVGKGWKEKISGIKDEHNPINKEIIAQVKGHNPFYGTTSVSLVLAAIVMLTEPSRMPKKGGVFSPGAAFAETSLIEQLNENGVSFKLIKKFGINQ